MNLDTNVCEKITASCLNFFDSEKPAAPLEMLECIWQDSGIAMHCPEHHYLLPAVLLTSVRRQLGDERQLLEQDLAVALERADNVLGGFCGNYGACGAAVGCGIFLSILTGTSPHSVQNWAQVNLITAEALTAIAGVDGPRCCKRDTYLSLQTTEKFLQEHYDIILPKASPACTHFSINQDCKRQLCPFFPKEHDTHAKD